MDCVLSYHMNPLTCGVARFNRALADKLGLPMLNIFDPDMRHYRRPLMSIKLSEFTDEDADRLEDAIPGWPKEMAPRLFLHDYSGTPVEAMLLRRSTAVYCGNEALVQELAPLHDNVIEGWCPGHLFDTHLMPEDAEISVYTFGMAHKMRADYFYQLHELLEATGKSYCLYVSAAIHEGKSLDDSFTAAYEELREVFGDRVIFLGFISDTALFNYLKRCTFFAAFFGSGVRANNTSVNTAMQCGSVVLTNLDEHSPADYKHMDSLVDIRQCKGGLPLDPAVLDRIAKRAPEVAAVHGWDPLLELIAANEPDLKSR